MVCSKFCWAARSLLSGLAQWCWRICCRSQIELAPFKGFRGCDWAIDRHLTKQLTGRVQFVCAFVCLFTFVCWSVGLLFVSFFLSVSLCVCLLVSLSVCFCVWLFVCFPVACLFVCLFVFSLFLSCFFLVAKWTFIFLFVCLFVGLFLLLCFFICWPAWVQFHC